VKKNNKKNKKSQVPTFEEAWKIVGLPPQEEHLAKKENKGGSYVL